MIDPICGMEVEPSKAAGSHIYNGQSYYFAAITVWRSSKQTLKNS
jgi:YHS domain-containing protein